MKREQKRPRKEITINELLTAISETEYPQYILDALEQIQDWMKASAPSGEDAAAFASMSDDDGESDFESLLERLGNLEEHADLIPGLHYPDGREDVVVISIASPDYDSGLRAAIDYTAVFSRPHCKRAWIVSDSFLFDEVIRYAPHVDALAEQGITLRFILITPWGWVELPLSGTMASKQQFIWHSPSESENKA